MQDVEYDLDVQARINQALNLHPWDEEIREVDVTAAELRAYRMAIHEFKREKERYQKVGELARQLLLNHLPALLKHGAEMKAGINVWVYNLATVHYENLFIPYEPIPPAWFFPGDRVYYRLPSIGGLKVVDCLVDEVRVVAQGRNLSFVYQLEEERPSITEHGWLPARYEKVAEQNVSYRPPRR